MEVRIKTSTVNAQVEIEKDATAHEALSAVVGMMICEGYRLDSIHEALLDKAADINIEIQGG